MTHIHGYPESLNALLTRLPELAVVLGPESKMGLEVVQSSLQAALLARSQGDIPQAKRQIGAAMDKLSQLANSLDPQEAVLMRMLSASFQQALDVGDKSEAERLTRVMRKNSGATVKKEPN